MKYGKLNEDVYERSVVKVIKTNSTKNRKFYDGAGIGSFCAVFPSDADKTISAQVAAGGKHAAKRAYETALNHIVAKGCTLENVYAVITLFVPERLREIKVREQLSETAKRADELKIPIMSVNVQVLPWVSMETVCCTVFADCKTYKAMAGAKPGDDIVMTKWIGLEGTAIMAENSLDGLKLRYPADIVEEAAGFLKYVSVIQEAACAVESGASYMQAAGEGGIFGALWELAANNSVGLVADLKRISVRQETIEICEYFDLNPYELVSGGSLLITCKNGNELVQKLLSDGIHAAVIGKITKGNDRIIRHEDESRFLEPARGDEIYNYYGKGRL